MRYLLTIIAFILFIESIDFVQFIQFAAADKILIPYLATYLEHVPMACIGGILLYVANGMVKLTEIKVVLQTKNKYHIILMVYTAAMVPLFGFMPAVLSAIALYIIFILVGLVEKPVRQLSPLKVI